MPPLEYVLCTVLGLMTLVWFVCVRKLSHGLRDRHAEKYEQMRLADLWPHNLAAWFSDHDNSRPVFALLRFLFRGEYLALRDADISSLSVFMRWLVYVYFGLFLVLVFAILSPDDQSRAGRGQDAVEVASPAQQRRYHAYELHRAKKWAQAIPVYDELLRESERDAELRYWRGMAHWSLNHPDQALEDFRRVIELEPANFEAHRSADRILSNQRRWDETVEMWGRYIERVPANAEAYFERGGTNFHKGDLAAAQSDAARACELGKSEACSLAERLKSRL